MLGENNYSRLKVGDLISWADISKDRHKRIGLILEKWIYQDNYYKSSRKVAMLRVTEAGTNEILNILALNVKIESQNTT